MIAVKLILEVLMCLFADSSGLKDSSGRLDRDVASLVFLPVAKRLPISRTLSLPGVTCA